METQRRARTHRSQTTRGALLQAAETCYATSGGGRVRLADVTQEAGVTTGALYWHFANLDDVVEALFGAYDAGVLRVLEDAGGLVDACRAWITLLAERPGTARVVVESVRPNRPLAAAKAAARQRWLAHLEPLLPPGIPAPERPVAAGLLVDAVEGLAYPGAARWAPRPDPDELARCLGRLAGALPPDPHGAKSPQRPGAAAEPSPQTLPEWQPHPSKQAPTTPRGRATCEAIRTAAVAVFADKGIIDATVADIARRAGVSAATVYQYFVDKHDVFRSALFQARGDILPAIELPPVDSRPPIGLAMSAYLGYSRAHAGLFRAFMESVETSDDYAAFWRTVRSQFTTWAEAVATAGQEAGRLPAGIRPALLAQLALDAAVRCAYERVLLGWDADVTDAEVAAVFERLLARGYEHQTG